MPPHVVVVLEHRQLVLGRQEIGCDVAGDSGADDGDLHRRLGRAGSTEGMDLPVWVTVSFFARAVDSDSRRSAAAKEEGLPQGRGRAA
jgi:hypothetical protein